MSTDESDKATDCCCDPADLVGNLDGTRSVPPFLASGVQLYAFPVGASYFKLNGLCDKYLNDPAPSADRWRPLGPVLYIQVLKYDRLTSEPYANDGYIRQNELVFHIPIISPFKEEGPRVGFFSAYLVVDNPLSMTVGREVFGYPKTYGSFTFQSTGISITNWLTPRSGRNVLYAEHPLIDQSGLNLAPGLPPEQAGSLWPFGPVDKLFRPQDGQDQVDDGRPPFALDEVAWSMLFDHAAMPIVHKDIAVEALKEIDSTTFLQPGPQKAAYQARISAISTPSLLRGAGPMISAPLKIHKYEPLNLVDIFGISTLLGKAPVWYPYWVDLDFAVHDTTLLTCHC